MRTNKNARRARPGARYMQAFDELYGGHSPRPARGGQGPQPVSRFLARAVANVTRATKRALQRRPG